MATTASNLIPILKASRHFPNRPSTASIWRWTLKGARGIKLQSTVIGGRRYVTPEAIADFIHATTVAANGSPVATVLGTSRKRELEIANAVARLNSDD